MKIDEKYINEVIDKAQKSLTKSSADTRNILHSCRKDHPLSCGNREIDFNVAIFTIQGKCDQKIINKLIEIKEYFINLKRKRREKVKNGINYLKDYIDTYDKQFGYKDYSDETIINDILYGLGVALSDNYKFFDGFEKFKDKLRKHLNEK